MKDKCSGSGQPCAPQGEEVLCPVCNKSLSLNRVHSDVVRNHVAKRDPNKLTLFEQRRLALEGELEC